jgi:O-antigen/teichoic acid export membrane protein
MFQTLTKWILGLTLPLVVGIVVFAPAWMRIFGHDFEVGWVVLVIGTLGQQVNCGMAQSATSCSCRETSAVWSGIHGVMARGMLALNIVLIPKWGIVGAAVGAALTNAVTNVWCLAEVRRMLGALPYSRSYWRLLLPVCGNLAVLLMVRTTLKAVRPE